MHKIVGIEFGHLKYVAEQITYYIVQDSVNKQEVERVIHQALCDATQFGHDNMLEQMSSYVSNARRLVPPIHPGIQKLEVKETPVEGYDIP